MEARLGRDEERLHLSFSGLGELARFAGAAARERGFVVELPEALRLYEALTVLFTAPDDLEVSVRASVAQVFPRGDAFTVAFLLEESPVDLAREVEELARLEADAGLEGAEEERPERRAGAPEGVQGEATRGETEEEDESEIRGASPIHRIQQLNPAQKALLARHAGRTERRILLRESSSRVLFALLQNPRIGAEEVVQMVRSTHANAPVLQHAAKDPRWGKNPEVLASIARHPQSPLLLASRLMGKLRTSDLRRMAKLSAGLREPVRKAALREYLGRIGR